MEYTTLGRTGLSVSRTAFGCLPIQRIPAADAQALLARAVAGGITFFDTARAYSDSEAKMGPALAPVRDRVVIATKTGARHAEGFWRDLETSLATLQTDYIDVYQFHNPSFVPRPGGEDGLYDAALEAKRQGRIRHIGITQHSLALAEEAVRSGLYDTLQFPFNHLASPADVALVELCAAENVGFICMKAMSGGLITDPALPFAYIRQYPIAVPIWGFQRMAELEATLALAAESPAIDDAMRARIEADRASLVGSFCRGCGYCEPCPAEIPIDIANRMTQLITRSPSAQWMTPEWQAKMATIRDCTRCGLCAGRCPYDLKPYETMPGHLAFYEAFVREHGTLVKGTR